VCFTASDHRTIDQSEQRSRWLLMRNAAPANSSALAWKEYNERELMMNHSYGWMGLGMLGWTFFCALVLVLLVVMLNKTPTK
jgi:FtsH-binding integral membrane protein